MPLDWFDIINEEFFAQRVEAETLDLLLANAWRHFGTHFFRYDLGIYENEIRRVMPLRIDVERFSRSKSQRRLDRRNADLDVQIRPAEITPETVDLFERHKVRFRSGVPSSIYDFLSTQPEKYPVPGMEVSVRDDEKLIAASFFDLGKASISSIYAMFDPAESARSLGIFTMLKEIEFAAAHEIQYYYHGYAYEGPSYYDYKKRFSGLETFDWQGHWSPMNG